MGDADTEAFTASCGSLPGTLGHLEHLTEFAIRLSSAVVGQETKERRLEYASHILTAVCLTADGILRTHPEGSYSRPDQRRIWNPVATAALARVLLEACINLYYFSVEEISEHEREFRFLIADLHCARERLHISDSFRLERDRFAPIAPDPEDVAGIEAMTAKAASMREELRRQLHDLTDQLLLNQYFQSRTERNQRKWREGEYRNGRYRGRGFVLELPERASRAGFRVSVYESEYRHLSSYIHTAPNAVDQLAAVGADPAGMFKEIIPGIVRGCCGALAVCIRYFISLFPELASLIEPDMCTMIDLFTTYATGPVWLLSAESG